VTVQNPWAKHYQGVWHERAGDPRLPYWFRVTALAFGCHCQNGHARFDKGQIGMVLGRLDPDTGEFFPLDRHNVRRAIDKAVEFGLLAEGSSALCLVVPAHAISGGVCGSPAAVCPLEQRHKELAESQRRRHQHLRAVG
jgi:hypothetical protein